MKSSRAINRSFVAVAIVSLSAAPFLPLGCGGNGFLGLEDYQRDLLVGGLLASQLLNQPATADGGGGGAQQPIPGSEGAPGPAGPSGADGTAGAEGADGVSGADGADGPAGPAGTQGQTGPAGPAGVAGAPGSAGANGASGGAGADGAQGPAGPEFFDVYIDDFFGFEGGESSLPVVLVNIETPALDIEGESAIAYRVAIPEGYEAGNDVTMRLFFFRAGGPSDGCFIFTLDARRLPDAGPVEVYNGPNDAANEGTRWIRIDSDDVVVPMGLNGSSGSLVVIDLPLNNATNLDGLTFNDDLVVGDLLAFELATHLGNGNSYQILAAEFFESPSGSAALDGAKVIFSEDEACCFDAPSDPVGPLAYISNTRSDDVWVLDIPSAAIVAVVGVGDDPRGIDIAPDNSRVYVANRFGGSVSVIDTATNTVVNTIDLEGNIIVSATEPYDVVVSPDGEWLYVAMKNGGDENGDGTVVVVDLPGGDVIAEVVLDGNASLEGIVVSPNGSKVYAAGRGSMYIVDVSTPSAPTSLGTSGSARRELVVSPDGAWIYAENNAVRVVDDVAFVTGDFSGSRGIAISPDGGVLYSTDEGSVVEVVEIEMVQGLPVTTFVENIEDVVVPQSRAYGIDLTDAGDLGVVSFRNSDTARIFDTATRSFVGPPIPMEFSSCTTTIFGNEPKQLVISHTLAP